MKIQIAERLRPFSLVPGAACLIPGTLLQIEAFPTLIRIGSWELKLRLTGPIEEFMLQQALEEHCVFVSGKAKEGFYRLRIEANDSEWAVIAERVPAGGLSTSEGVLQKTERVKVPFAFAFAPGVEFERLSLGSHKAQNWDEVQKRSDLKEILPVFYCLAQKIPLVPEQSLSGTARLLEMPKERSDLSSSLESFFKAAFKKILIPRLQDDQHQGLSPDEPVTGSPFFLIQEGFKRIRSLFFHQNERRLSFLPQLPIPLHCGRLLKVQVNGVGELDFEWSKKTLRRVVFRATTSGEVVLILQKGLDSFRVRKSLNEKGVRHSGGEPLLLEAGETCFLDRFQK